MKNGKYQVCAQGHGSESMPMAVTIEDDKIKNIEIDSSGETKGVADEVFNRLPKQIINNQTLNVDAVSGATISSHGVVDGIAQAITEAGGDATKATTSLSSKFARRNLKQAEKYSDDVQANQKEKDEERQKGKGRNSSNHLHNQGLRGF